MKPSIDRKPTMRTTFVLSNPCFRWHDRHPFADRAELDGFDSSLLAGDARSSVRRERGRP